MSNLTEYLRLAAAEPFEWGKRDCALWAADWVVLRRGIDPAPDLRDKYSTALQCARIVRSEGGLLWLALRRLSYIGVHETSEPQPGDVGCIKTPIGEAIVLRTPAGRWAWKGEGLLMFDCPALASWRI